MVNASADPDFFVREGGGVQAQRRENSLDFLCLFWVFLVQFFPGMRGGVQLFTRGVQMPISIEFDRTCDLPGMGSGPPTPPPTPSGSARTCMNKVERGRIGNPTVV